VVPCVLEAGEPPLWPQADDKSSMSSPIVAMRKAAGEVVKADGKVGEAEGPWKERQAALKNACQQPKDAAVKHAKKIAREELHVTRSENSARGAKDKVRPAHLLACFPIFLAGSCCPMPHPQVSCLPSPPSTSTFPGPHSRSKGPFSSSSSFLAHPTPFFLASSARCFLRRSSHFSAGAESGMDIIIRGIDSKQEPLHSYQALQIVCIMILSNAI
jgi:hypothetical protein